MNFIDDYAAVLGMQELLTYLNTFSDLSSRYIQEVCFAKNEIIVPSTESPNYFYLIKTGIAFIEIPSESKEREVIYFLTPNQLYSPESLYSNFKEYLSLFPRQLRAGSKVTAYKIDCDFMMDHLYAQPKHLNFLFQTVLRELSSAQLISHIHKLPTQNRIDMMLKIIMDSVGVIGNDGVSIPSAINQSVLASLCSLSQSAISLRLKKLVENGTLASTYTPLLVRDPQFLKKQNFVSPV
ncbi:transcriptional regulator [Listeria floridensis FSL S10-1187]|uniref:Transcriptional regulator n=1 Tax=Listeria floridensis FSL S10-1187 TaxID=1265817 RepID=A0ABP3B2W3_9LIST|nr:Crp/Fnr family transcriptional regulator [Listeria floridensis]EUJ33646.1 transcriptional regulator [Listeria floridensis FSL S10-1187]